VLVEQIPVAAVALFSVAVEREAVPDLADRRVDSELLVADHERVDDRRVVEALDAP
jgi:hypothetical protein